MQLGLSASDDGDGVPPPKFRGSADLVAKLVFWFKRAIRHLGPGSLSTARRGHTRVVSEAWSEGFALDPSMTGLWLLSCHDDSVSRKRAASKGPWDNSAAALHDIAQTLTGVCFVLVLEGTLGSADAPAVMVCKASELRSLLPKGLTKLVVGGAQMTWLEAAWPPKLSQMMNDFYNAFDLMKKDKSRDEQANWRDKLKKRPSAAPDGPKKRPAAAPGGARSTEAYPGHSVLADRAPGTIMIYNIVYIIQNYTLLYIIYYIIIIFILYIIYQ